MEYWEAIQIVSEGLENQRGATQWERGPQRKQVSIGRWSPRETAASRKLGANLEKCPEFPASELCTWVLTGEIERNARGHKGPKRWNL